MRNLARGAGSVLNLFPQSKPFERPAFLGRTDAEAIASDWQEVGDDMREAMRKFEEEIDDA